MKEIKIWEPIAFSEEWTATDTSLVDELAASWFQKRIISYPTISKSLTPPPSFRKTTCTGMRSRKART